MSVQIKKNPATKEGKQTLYLLTYHNYKSFREPLNTFIYAEEKTQAQKEHNKNRWLFAEKIRVQRALQFDEGGVMASTSIKSQGSFLDYFKELMREKSGVDGSFNTWQSTYKHMQVFLNGRDLKFKECDDDFLKGFKSYLLKCTAINRTLKLSNNSANIYMSKVKAALNRAINDRIIIDNPGKRIKNVKTQEVNIEFLCIDDLKRLTNADCKIPVLKRAFLFSCASGLRWSDIHKLKWGEVVYSEEEKRWKIHFTQQKTKGKLYHPIPDQALQHLGQFGEESSKVFKGLSYSAYNNRILANWVKSAGINKHITFHCARHTYAVLMQTLTDNILLVSNMLGHKDIKTTMRYAKVSNSTKNKAVDLFPNFS